MKFSLLIYRLSRNNVVKNNWPLEKLFTVLVLDKTELYKVFRVILGQKFYFKERSA